MDSIYDNEVQIEFHVDVYANSRIRGSSEYYNTMTSNAFLFHIYCDGYDIVEVPCLNNPREKVAIAKCYLKAENGKKTYLSTFIPLKNMLAVRVRLWAAPWYN